MNLFVRKSVFDYAKTKTQISFVVTAKLISAFVFATRIVQYIYSLNTKFEASSPLLWLYSRACVGPGWKPQRPVFSQRGSYMSCVMRKSVFRISDQVLHFYFYFCTAQGTNHHGQVTSAKWLKSSYVQVKNIKLL